MLHAIGGRCKESESLNSIYLREIKGHSDNLTTLKILLFCNNDFMQCTGRFDVPIENTHVKNLELNSMLFRR